jgi:hypothetical protein
MRVLKLKGPASYAVMWCSTRGHCVNSIITERKVKCVEGQVILSVYTGTWPVMYM